MHKQLMVTITMPLARFADNDAAAIWKAFEDVGMQKQYLHTVIELSKQKGSPIIGVTLTGDQFAKFLIMRHKYGGKNMFAEMHPQILGTTNEDGVWPPPEPTLDVARNQVAFELDKVETMLRDLMAPVGRNKIMSTSDYRNGIKSIVHYVHARRGDLQIGKPAEFGPSDKPHWDAHFAAGHEAYASSAWTGRHEDRPWQQRPRNYDAERAKIAVYLRRKKAVDAIRALLNEVITHLGNLL